MGWVILDDLSTSSTSLNSGLLIGVLDSAELTNAPQCFGIWVVSGKQGGCLWSCFRCLDSPATGGAAQSDIGLNTRSEPSGRGGWGHGYTCSLCVGRETSRSNVDFLSKHICWRCPITAAQTSQHRAVTVSVGSALPVPAPFQWLSASVPEPPPCIQSSREDLRS